MQSAGARWWLCAMSLLLGGSCSLLFEPQLSLSGDASPQATDAGPQPDSSGRKRAMMIDDFESGTPAEGWTGLLLENGDSCSVTTDQAAGGSQRSLRCTTDGASGTMAAIYLDFAPTQTLKVEMDVRFDTLPTTSGKWLTYLQASNGSTRLTNSDLYPSRKIDLWRYSDNTFEYAKRASGEDLLIDTAVWYHIVFVVQIGEAFVSVDSDASARLQLPEMLPIDRLLLGITLVDDSIEEHTMYMDNIVISEN